MLEPLFLCSIFSCWLESALRGFHALLGPTLVCVAFKNAVLVWKFFHCCGGLVNCGVGF